MSLTRNTDDLRASGERVRFLDTGPLMPSIGIALLAAGFIIPHRSDGMSLAFGYCVLLLISGARSLRRFTDSP
jgi:hypothetical protein